MQGIQVDRKEDAENDQEKFARLAYPKPADDEGD
jgi:hypothetical protein